MLFVLGAVRDLLPAELRAVRRAARRLALRRLELRLGKTPEFSSKARLRSSFEDASRSKSGVNHVKTIEK